MNNYQAKMMESLNNDGSVDFTDLIAITEAFQIASGQGYAIGKSKAILEYLKNVGELPVVTDATDRLMIRSAQEFANLIFQIDNTVNIETNKNLKMYFTR